MERRSNRCRRWGELGVRRGTEDLDELTWKGVYQSKLSNVEFI
jgi:hypothetical protein